MRCPSNNSSAIRWNFSHPLGNSPQLTPAPTILILPCSVMRNWVFLPPCQFYWLLWQRHSGTVNNLRQNRRRGMMNGSKPYGPPVRHRTPRGRHSPCAGQWFHSPHPDPLPRGEGTASHAQWKANGCGMSSGQRRAHPLPEREGWCEGKRHEAQTAYGANPGIVGPSESSGRAGDFPKWV